MSKYATPAHQNLSVWARRAGVEIKDLDVAVKYTEKNFGVGRRATLRFVLERSFHGAGFEPNTSRFLGCVAADLVYEVAYDSKEFNNSKEHFSELLCRYKVPANVHNSCMLFVDDAIIAAKALLAARVNEQQLNGRSITGMILNHLRKA